MSDYDPTIRVPPTSAGPAGGGAPPPGTPPPPSGPPPGPPGGFGTPPPPSGSGSGFTRTHLVIIGVVIVILLAAIGGILALRSDDAAADEVFLEPVDFAGENPFTEGVDTGEDGAAQKAIDDAARAGSSSSGVPTYSGGEPGLDGGTQSGRHCDRGQLVQFLQANPDKARAWADVLGITVGEIPDYVDDLTPVLLREDTRVTNHGFVDGRANPIPAVLQAGTAVLVDRFGRPVVKCNCGNPLVAPTPAASPRYTGTSWTGFSPTTITVIQQTTIEIDVFVLTDALTGERFRRPAGTDGDADTPDEDPPPPTTSSTLPPPTLPPPQPPDEDGAEEALAIFDAADQQCTADGVEYPFDDAASVDSANAFPTADPDVYDVQIERTSTAGEYQFFSFLVDIATGDISPNSDLAFQAAAACPALG